MAEQSLKDKTVKGVAWSGIDNVVQMGVMFIVSIILANLLSPDDYGLLSLQQYAKPSSSVALPQRSSARKMRRMMTITRSSS